MQSTNVVKNSPGRMRAKNKRYLPLLLMTLPGMAYLIINNYIPMGGVMIAFQNYNYRKGMFHSRFIGFRNFEYLLRSPDLSLILTNTVVYNICFIVFGTIVSIALAVLMSEIKSRHFGKVFQVSILIPYMISMVLVSYVVYALIHPTHGFLNNAIFPMLGIEKINFYTEPGPWRIILPLVHVWKNAGYNSIIYYATICGIDPEIYEAAKIDGASRWKQVRYLTLPMLVPTVCMLTIMAVGRIFSSDFGLFYQVTLNSTALYPATNVIDVYVYNALMRLNDVGMSSAVGLLQSVVGCLLLLSTNFVVRKISPENSIL